MIRWLEHCLDHGLDYFRLSERVIVQDGDAGFLELFARRWPGKVNRLTFAPLPKRVWVMEFLDGSAYAAFKILKCIN